jgi:hypothetical protein
MRALGKGRDARQHGPGPLPLRHPLADPGEAGGIWSDQRGARQKSIYVGRVLTSGPRTLIEPSPWRRTTEPRLRSTPKADIKLIL